MSASAQGLTLFGFEPDELKGTALRDVLALRLGEGGACPRPSSRLNPPRRQQGRPDLSDSPTFPLHSTVTQGPAPTTSPRRLLT